MLQLARDLRGYKLIARDGEIGKAEEFYFDDQSWAVRYLIAETGGWLVGRQVLISPYALDPARKDDQVIPGHNRPTGRNFERRSARRYPRRVRRHSFRRRSRFYRLR